MPLLHVRHGREVEPQAKAEAQQYTLRVTATGAQRWTETHEKQSEDAEE